MRTEQEQKNLCVKHELRQMLKQGHGSIVNTSLIGLSKTAA
jgi:hypothetical protein